MSEKKQEFLPYKIVYQPGSGEIVEKKSRFIAHAAPAASEEEAAAFIESVRKKYYDARHHCFAFIIGRNREVTRYSDDGEPGGTAGRPILEVLLAGELTNTVVVVTRYFGGTLLGTGGLVRAYTEAAKEGIKSAGMAVMYYGALLALRTDYTDLGKIQYLLGSKKIAILNSQYTDKVELTVKVPEKEVSALMAELTESTAGRVAAEIQEKDYYMEKDLQQEGHAANFVDKKNPLV